MAVATSERTRGSQSPSACGSAPEEAGRLDVAVDGADEVDPSRNLVKGGRGAHTREKVVARMAERFVVVVDESKLVHRLGDFGVPLEVLDFAPEVVAGWVRDLGAEVVERRPDPSDSGNPLMLAHFGPIENPAVGRRALRPARAGGPRPVPGRHGEARIVGTPDGSVRQL